MGIYLRENEINLVKDKTAGQDFKEFSTKWSRRSKVFFQRSDEY